MRAVLIYGQSTEHTPSRFVTPPVLSSQALSCVSTGFGLALKLDGSGHAHISEDPATVAATVHGIPFMYGLRGQVTTPDASGIFDKASSRGLKVDLDYLEQELAKRNGTLSGAGKVGPADVSSNMRRKVSRYVGRHADLSLAARCLGVVIASGCGAGVSAARSRSNEARSRLLLAGIGHSDRSSDTGLAREVQGRSRLPGRR